MPEPLKDLMYNAAFFAVLVKEIRQILPGFDEDRFMGLVYAPPWDDLELKQRMRRTSNSLQACLGNDYPKNIEVLLQLVTALEKKEKNSGLFGYMFIPDFVEQYGLDHYDLSMEAMEQITQLMSCEFAIRPFISRYPVKTIEKLLQWSKHPHAHVRRLASEGCRPRLPWAAALPALKKDPSSIIPILENLKQDPSEFVRRSVANNLNDISKDHPELVIHLARSWKGKDPGTDRLIKHACRTLLKSGYPDAMELFGFGSSADLFISNLSIQNPEISLGESLQFSFDLENKADVASKVRLEYAIYYQKANGKLSGKVYQISEKEYPGKSTTTITKKRPFQQITTRRFHPGLHRLAIIVNGRESDAMDLNLSV